MTNLYEFLQRLTMGRLQWAAAQKQPFCYVSKPEQDMCLPQERLQPRTKRLQRPSSNRECQHLQISINDHKPCSFVCV